jgi:hypothetical protein
MPSQPLTKEIPMSGKTMLVIGGAAVSLTAGSALLIGPTFGVATAKSHTVKFDAVSTSATQTGGGSFVGSDNDMKGAKQIGADVIYCVPGNAVLNCHVAFASKGGQIYGRFAISDADGSLRGKITGGSNSFAHAKGTIKGTAPSKSTVAITLTVKK